jgi:hypothetical protein
LGSMPLIVKLAGISAIMKRAGNECCQHPSGPGHNLYLQGDSSYGSSPVYHVHG